jgi:hypothetical protein
MELQQTPYLDIFILVSQVFCNKLNSLGGPVGFRRQESVRKVRVSSQCGMMRDVVMRNIVVGDVVKRRSVILLVLVEASLEEKSDKN